MRLGCRASDCLPTFIAGRLSVRRSAKELRAEVAVITLQTAEFNE